MTTPKGHTSTWHFTQCTTGWYAFGGCHKPLVKKFDSIKQLRALYRNYLQYGYRPVGEPNESFVRFTPTPADPWDVPVSTLPKELQLELAALS